MNNSHYGSSLDASTLQRYEKNNRRYKQYIKILKVHKRLFDERRAASYERELEDGLRISYAGQMTRTLDHEPGLK